MWTIQFAFNDKLFSKSFGFLLISLNTLARLFLFCYPVLLTCCGLICFFYSVESRYEWFLFKTVDKIVWELQFPLFRIFYTSFFNRCDKEKKLYLFHVQIHSSAKCYATEVFRFISAFSWWKNSLWIKTFLFGSHSHTHIKDSFKFHAVSWKLYTIFNLMDILVAFNVVTQYIKISETL